MKRRLGWVLIAIGVCAVVAALYFWDPRKPTDAKRLQGSWVSAEGVRVTFSGDLIVLELGRGEDPRRMFYRLDRRARPKRMIAWSADLPALNEPRMFLGVDLGPKIPGPKESSYGLYELDGDRLRILMQNRGEDFPASFDPKPDVSVMDFRRE